MRACAALGLGIHQDVDALEQLLADPTATVRAAAAWAMRSVSRPRVSAHSRLMAIAAADEDLRVRAAATSALELGNPSTGTLEVVRLETPTWGTSERGSMPAFGTGERTWFVIAR
jgi:HEAT repeat protein